METTSSPPCDETLLLAIAEKDESALAAFYARHSTLIYSVALRILRDKASAEDVVQEVFLQIWRSPNDFIRIHGSIGSWLAVVARNRSIDILRGRKAISLDDAPPVASTHDLAAEVDEAVTTERLKRCITSLPSEQKMALELAFFQGLTRAEIARRTGQPLGTVNTRIRLAVRTIRKLVGRKLRTEV